jgi:hypothetical protein
VLGVGTIDKKSNREQHRLSFYKKDLVNVIIPLKKYYNLKFLTYNRSTQFKLLMYVLDNNIIYWDEIKDLKNNMGENYIIILCSDLIKLDWFKSWELFNFAEGCFSFKSDGSAFYTIRQGGLENLEIIKAICLIITNRECRPIKPDTGNSYKLTITSKLEINKVLNFFTSFLQIFIP